jgi:hypothetical protein
MAKLSKEQKGKLLVEKSLEKYKQMASEKVRQELCILCRDRRCDRGVHCNAYQILVESVAAGMTSSEDN